MVASILLTILILVLTLVLESFLSVLLSFSIFIILALSLIEKWDWKKWVFLFSLASVLVDIALHRLPGTTLMALSLSSLLLYLLLLVMPKKQLLLSYIPYFLSVTLFYILLQLFSPLLADGIWGILTPSSFFGILIKALLSTLLIFGIEKLIDKFRTEKSFTI